VNRINAFSSSRKGRLIWLFAAAIFLALAVFALLVAVRTRADDGLGTGWWEHHIGDRGTATETLPESVVEGIPAALYPAYPSPFRPLPERQETEALTEPATETEAATEGEEIVYHSRHNDRMEIALSFDDGPHPRLTPVILEILEEYGIKATFFMVGENVGYYPAAARAVVEAGHEIGNHTFSHRKFGRMDRTDMEREIVSCEEAIAALTERPVRFIRPPEGEMSETVRRVAGELRYRVILWDVDTRDWAHTPPDEISRHILDTVQAGDIILMHDFIGYDSPTPEALRRVIPALLERGYRFVTVGELVDE
jgi:peptidoglycan/xylan/chitin deacetylase (PgdA/CDA1 family)